MWKTIYVAVTSEEAKLITETLDKHHIAYELEPGPVADSVAILVHENDLRVAEALLQEQSVPEPSQVAPPQERGEVSTSELRCARCSVLLRYRGKRSIQVGFWATGYMDVEVYVCPRCGHIELFEPIILRDFIAPDHSQGADR